MVHLCDFRVGNVILINGVLSKISPSDLLTIEKMINSCNELIDYNPIPLTADNLLRLGFESTGNGENDNEDSYFFTINSKLWFDGYFSTYTEKTGIFEVNIRSLGNVLCHSFEYVHQIQNLFYCVKGYELDFM
jgi:hypothetical protein